MKVCTLLVCALYLIKYGIRQGNKQVFLTIFAFTLWNKYYLYKAQRNDLEDLYVCLSIYRLIDRSISLSVCPSVCPSVCLSVRLSVCPSVCLLSVCLSIDQPASLSVCLSVQPSFRPSICLSVS